MQKGKLNIFESKVFSLKGLCLQSLFPSSFEIGFRLDGELTRARVPVFPGTAAWVTFVQVRTDVRVAIYVRVTFVWVRNELIIPYAGLGYVIRAIT